MWTIRPPTTCDYQHQLDGKRWNCPHKVYQDGKCIFHAPTEDKTVKEVSTEFRERVGIGSKRGKQFVGAEFEALDLARCVLEAPDNHPIDLRHARFEGQVTMARATVMQPLRLDDAVVEGAFNVKGTTFIEEMTLSRTRFEGSVEFKEAAFDRVVSRQGAEFVGEDSEMALTVDGCRFEGDVEFTDAEFRGFEAVDSTFEGDLVVRKSDFRVGRGNTSVYCDSTFGRTAVMQTVFEKEAEFGGSEFRGETGFRVVEFGEASFVGTEFGMVTFLWTTFDEADFTATTFNGRADFSEPYGRDGFRASFEDAAFRGDVEFRELSFHDGSSFARAAFGEAVTFVDVDFEDVTFRRTTIGGPLRFGDASFGGRTDFEELTAHGLADFSSGESGPCFEGTAVFKGARFTGSTEFVGAEFRGRAEFGSVEFDDVNFRNVEFCGKADFGSSVRHSATDFTGMLVRGDGVFRQTRFTGITRFDDCRFRGDAHFEDATFEAKVSFEEGRVAGVAAFERTAFGTSNKPIPKVNFVGVVVGIGRFEGTKFPETATFEGAKFGSLEMDPAGVIASNTLNLRKADIESGTLGQPNDGPLVYDLSRGTLGDVTLDGGTDGTPAFWLCRLDRTDYDGFDFRANGLSAVGSKIHSVVDSGFTDDEQASDGGVLQKLQKALPSSSESGDETASEDGVFEALRRVVSPPLDRDMEPSDIEVTYRNAKKGASENGDVASAGDFFVKEMVNRRRGHAAKIRHPDGPKEWVRRLYNWLTNLTLALTSGYGERPRRVVVSSVGVVAAFALLYWNQFPQFGRPGPATLFSVQSFVTFLVGPPMKDASSLLEWFSAVEGFLGAFLVALFVFTLTRAIHR